MAAAVRVPAISRFCATSILFVQVSLLAVFAFVAGMPPASATDWFGGVTANDVQSLQPLNNFAKLDLPAPYRYQPILGIDVAALALLRSGPDSFPLVADDSASSNVIETSDVLQPRMAVGSRIAVTLYNLTRYTPGLDMDFIFLNVDDTVAKAVVDANGHATTNVLPIFYGGVPSSPTTSYTMTLDSDLESGEWNLAYRPLPRLRLIAGLRWLRLEENFDVLQTAALASGANSGFFSHAINDAFGFQVGGEATIWTSGRARVFGRGKYAILNNEVGGDAVSQNVSFTYNGNVDTSLVDLELGGSLWLTTWASLQIAYQGLFLADAAGALEQSNQQSFFDPATQQAAFHELSWNGFHAGISMIW